MNFTNGFFYKGFNIMTDNKAATVSCDGFEFICNTKMSLKSLEPVFIRNVCGFSSIILLQTRQKSAGGLSPGKDF